MTTARRPRFARTLQTCPCRMSRRPNSAASGHVTGGRGRADVGRDRASYTSATGVSDRVYSLTVQVGGAVQWTERRSLTGQLSLIYA